MPPATSALTEVNSWTGSNDSIATYEDINFTVDSNKSTKKNGSGLMIGVIFGITGMSAPLVTSNNLPNFDYIAATNLLRSNYYLTQEDDDSATSDLDYVQSGTKSIEPILEKLYYEGKRENFEPGIETNFHRKFKSLLLANEQLVLDLIGNHITANLLSTEVLGEILKLIGEYAAIRQAASGLLITNLKHHSSLIRDTSSLALADLLGTDAIPHIQIAINHEKHESLKGDFSDLINSLS